MHVAQRRRVLGGGDAIGEGVMADHDQIGVADLDLYGGNKAKLKRHVIADLQPRARLVIVTAISPIDCRCRSTT